MTRLSSIPMTADWSAVAAGKVNVRVRQLPGPENAMGRMKFMFPNVQGIYLHDTPEKNLLGEEARMFSGGCVRLEDASRLAKWLYDGHPPSARSAQPEQRVDLPKPVPVFLTYLTAIPTAGAISYLPDIYGRDPGRAGPDRQPARTSSAADLAHLRQVAVQRFWTGGPAGPACRAPGSSGSGQS